MPYISAIEAKKRRKKYYYEVEKPKRQKKRERLVTKKANKKADRKRREKEAKNYAWNIKKTQGCSDCTEIDPACLVFHHLDPSNKRASIHKLYKYGVNAVRKEIKKCKLICANCHMKFHYYEAKDGEGITTSVKIAEKKT